MTLETTTIPAVPILRVGKGFQGLNCPIRGCEFTISDLDDIAMAYLETRGAVTIPIKLGHNDKQELLDGLPAAGWVENVRRIADHLIADLVDVPARIVALMQAKVYRNRSVELETKTVGGKRYPLMLVGLALLGADLPAVTGLPDIEQWFSHRHQVCACPDPLEPTADEMHIAIQLGLSREAIMAQKRRDRADEIEGERQAMKFHQLFNERR